MNIPLSVASIKSLYFLSRTKDACIISSDNKDKATGNSQNYFSHYFLDAYIMSVTALESYINERISYMQMFYSGETTKEEFKALSTLKEKSLCDKYYDFSKCYCTQSFDKGVSPYQDFSFLVSLRNDIVHCKMPFYNRMTDQPAWHNHLNTKKILIQEGTNNMQIDEALTYEGARWAYNTSLSMMKFITENMKNAIFRDMSKREIKDFYPF